MKLVSLIAIFSLSIALLPAHAISTYLPHQGDSFTYYEVLDLNGNGGWAGYTEHTATNGMERINQVFSNGNVSSYYTFTWSWSNSSGSTNSGGSSGNFTWSSTNFLYLKGNDSQTGYVNPLAVWFYIDNSSPQGSSLQLLDTPMSVTSTSYSYHLASQNRNVNTIRAEGTSSYHRDDTTYGAFNAAYTWTTYFDPQTGYIIGYDYNEQDTNSTTGIGFGLTESLYVTSTSYPLTAAAATSNLAQYLVYIGVFFLIIVIIVIIAVAVSRSRRRLPKHTYPQVPIAPPQIDLTPKQQPPVQQIVVKEVVKVKCRYCGALIDSTVQACPFCGAPRT